MKKIVIKKDSKSYNEITALIKKVCIHMTNHAENSPAKNGQTALGLRIYYSEMNKRLLGTTGHREPKNPYCTYINKTDTAPQSLELSVSATKYKNFLNELAEGNNPPLAKTFKNPTTKTPTKKKATTKRI
tara:strand:- start:6 stop:395 length:390 start_codon:yes stop_codon:yes gene_type:complete